MAFLVRNVIFLITIIKVYSAITDIDRVDDTDLVHLLTNQDNLVALFTKDNCPECIKYEGVLSSIQEELMQSLGASVVKAHDSNLVPIYDPTKEPALLYFRRGIPILYYGDIDGDEILQFFIDNREPVVKELSDENFEHLTQASTGATTGDWFIFFYSSECIPCQRLYAVWEAVGGKLKRKLNVARVNRLEHGTSTAARLGVVESPEFIFLRQGKMYKYIAEIYTPKGFIEFAELGYTLSPNPKNVPAQPELMDNFIQQLQDYVKNTSGITVAVVILSTLASIYLLLAKCLSRKPQQKVAKKSN